MFLIDLLLRARQLAHTLASKMFAGSIIKTITSLCADVVWKMYNHFGEAKPCSNWNHVDVKWKLYLVKEHKHYHGVYANAAAVDVAAIKLQRNKILCNRQKPKEANN